MKLPQLSLRELFWLVLVCALAVGWWRDQSRLSLELKELKYALAKAESRSSITWVNPRKAICWIDLGKAVGLPEKTTFDVFERDERGFPVAEPKARIQVVRVLDEYLAECRILEQDEQKPLTPGDRIVSNAWQPLR